MFSLSKLLITASSTTVTFVLRVEIRKLYSTVLTNCIHWLYTYTIHNDKIVSDRTKEDFGIFSVSR